MRFSVENGRRISVWGITTQRMLILSFVGFNKFFTRICILLCDLLYFYDLIYMFKIFDLLNNWYIGLDCKSY